MFQNVTCLAIFTMAAMIAGCSDDDFSWSDVNHGGDTNSEYDGGGDADGDGDTDTDSDSDTDSDGDADTDADADTDTDADGDSDTDSDADGDTDTDSDTDSSANAATRYFPLAVGNSWTYNVVAQGSNPSCQAGTYTAEVLQELTVGGRGAFEFRGHCSTDISGQVISYLSQAEGRIEQYSNPDWHVGLGSPVTQGHTWIWNASTTFRWEAIGQTTVPAGTFDNCFNRVEISASQPTTTFCRDVGKVRVIDPGAYESELISYALN